MTNLVYVSNLREKYDPNFASGKTADEINNGRVVWQQVKKGFSLPEAKLNKYREYFQQKSKSHVSILFIDICSFSKKLLGKNNDQILCFLEEYYKYVIPIIYEYNGEIDRIMGDGIICVFGKPFVDDVNVESLLRKAECCAYRIIKLLKSSPFECKVALHSGEVVFINNNILEYDEYTMIGQCITDLYRLESVAVDNAISFFSDSDYDDLVNSDVEKFRQENRLSRILIETTKKAPMTLSDKIIDTSGLKGINWSSAKYLVLSN